MTIRKIILLAAGCAMLSGCGTVTNSSDRAVIGGAIGLGIGAGVTGNPGGAIAGAAIGAALGAVTSSSHQTAY